MSKYTYILDPAHGKNVAGKRSPDGKHREYLWSRWFIESILVDMRSKHYDFEYPL
jgi:N-acetylmuramoyl-L-alanine amidase